MTKYLFTNNASSTLAANIGPTDTTLTVAAGEGTKFPAPGAGQQFNITVIDTGGNYEVMTCTSRTGDTLTVTRGVESTTALSFASGSRVELRLTAAVLNNMLQLGGGTMSGNLDMGSNKIKNADMTGETLPVGTVKTGLIQPADGDTTYQITLPNGGARPKVGGAVVLDAALFANIIFMYSGPASSIPSGFKLCDGTNGTPDLRDKFIIGSGNTYNTGDTGGATSATTSQNGAHAHTGTTGDHTLTVAQIPNHGHPTYVSTTVESTFQSRGTGGFPLTTSGASAYAAYSGTVSATPGQQVGGTGGDQPHNHPISSDGDHTHTVSTMPPYYALAFVMLDPGAL